MIEGILVIYLALGVFVFVALYLSNYTNFRDEYIEEISNEPISDKIRLMIAILITWPWLISDAYKLRKRKKDGI